MELEGTIKRIKNKFYIEIEVPLHIKLEDILINIKGYYHSIGNITLINNKNISIKSSLNMPNINIYEYEVGYVISGYIDEKTALISSMSIYFKELDYFFVEDRYKIDVEKLDKELTITQKYRNEILLENENILIEYNKTAGISKDYAGHILFLNPAKLYISFKTPLALPQVFEEINKIENCLGFVFCRKMNLLETIVNDLTGLCHAFIAPFQKDFNEVILSDFHIVDLNSKQLLKDVLEKYYNNERIAATINMFYEYIYNDLDNIFEFTSLVNTLELILSDEKYENNIREYAQESNEELKENNKKMHEIFKVLSKKQSKFIKNFYKFDNVVLRDKIRYILYKEFNLKENDNSEKYISAIIKTRNY